jgi:hypothetical protein
LELYFIHGYTQHVRRTVLPRRSSTASGLPYMGATAAGDFGRDGMVVDPSTLSFSAQNLMSFSVQQLMEWELDSGLEGPTIGYLCLRKFKR